MHKHIGPIIRGVTEKGGGYRIRVTVQCLSALPYQQPYCHKNTTSHLVGGRPKCLPTLCWCTAVRASLYHRPVAAQMLLALVCVPPLLNLPEHTRACAQSNVHTHHPQKNSRRFLLSISCLVPEVLEFIAFHDQQKLPVYFPRFSWTSQRAERGWFRSGGGFLKFISCFRRFGGFRGSSKYRGICCILNFEAGCFQFFISWFSWFPSRGF